MADTASGRQQLALALAGGVVLGEPRHTHRSGAAGWGTAVGLLACCWGRARRSCRSAGGEARLRVGAVQLCRDRSEDALRVPAGALLERWRHGSSSAAPAAAAAGGPTRGDLVRATTTWLSDAPGEQYETQVGPEKHKVLIEPGKGSPPRPYIQQPRNSLTETRGLRQVGRTWRRCRCCCRRLRAAPRRASSPSCKRPASPSRRAPPQPAQTHSPWR